MKPQGESTEEKWRELAKQVAVEQDPKEMIALVEQLIAKLDAARQRKSPE